MIYLGSCWKKVGARMLRYCTNCVMPNTKPDLRFDEEGVCSACNFYRDRMSIDWAKRKIELEKIFDEYRKISKKS